MYHQVLQILIDLEQNNALKNEIRKAGFSKISVKDFVFHYSPGKFEDYWKNYLKYIAKPLKEKLNELDYSKRKELKQTSQRKNITIYKEKWKYFISLASFNFNCKILGLKRHG